MTPAESRARKQHTKRSPIGITPTTWYYEQRMGITVVQEHRTAAGEYLGTVQCMIPFRLLAASLRRIAKARGVRL